MGLRRLRLQEMGHLETTAGPTGRSGKERGGRILLELGGRSHGQDGRQLMLALAPTSGRATVGILHVEPAGRRKKARMRKRKENVAKRMKRSEKKRREWATPLKLKENRHEAEYELAVVATAIAIGPRRRRAIEAGDGGRERGRRRSKHRDAEDTEVSGGPGREARQGGEHGRTDERRAGEKRQHRQGDRLPTRADRQTANRQ